jgi:hypothetical protein
MYRCGVLFERMPLKQNTTIYFLQHLLAPKLISVHAEVVGRNIGSNRICFTYTKKGFGGLEGLSR